MDPRCWRALIPPGAAHSAGKTLIAHKDTCGADDAMSNQQYSYWRGGIKVSKRWAFTGLERGRDHEGCEKLSGVVENVWGCDEM